MVAEAATPTPVMTVDMTPDVTVMTGSGIADVVMTWLEGLENGQQGDVMTRGKHFYFNCDGRNHYVYEVDESRREIKKNGKPGRKKRTYVGVLSAARTKCPTEAARWEARHTCKGGHDTGGSFGPVGEIAGRPVFVGRERQ
jgi:hypothetical protein